MTRSLLLAVVTSIASCAPSGPTPGRLVGALGSSGMVVSQIYGGGGNSGAALSHDYVELFNRGTTAVTMTGWSVQYASATSSTWAVHALPTLTVDPGRYVLIQLASQNVNVGAPLPMTADSTGTINLNATVGKVALLSSTTACGNPCASSAAVVDLVGYGTTASEYEGARAPEPTGNSSVLLRKGSGCVDSDDNASDFVLGTWTTPSSLVLHNSASTASACAPTDAGSDQAAADAGPTADASPPDAPAPTPGAVVVSQIYGAGGNTGAKYTHDYVELFNRGTVSVAVGGWSLQYGPSTGDFSQKADLPAGATIDPGEYFLVQLGGGGAGVALPAPDLVTSGGAAYNLSASAGKVALVANATLLTCGSAANRCTSATIMDLVGYGAASDYEGTAATAPAQATQAMFRVNGGCTDTGDNAAEIVVATAEARNSASPVHSCTVAPDAGVPDGSPDASLPVDAGAPPAKGAVVVSQIYGAGGNSGAKYTHDYVELFNRGAATVAIGGWSVQYGTATNAFSQKTSIPAGATIGPGRYFLVQLAGGTTGVALPAPDLATTGSGAYNISASGGKIALVGNATLLACGTAADRCSSPWIMDLVGYGSASDYEGAPTSAASQATQGKLRLNGGCTDSDHNGNDFATATADARNSVTAAHSCAAAPDAGPPDATPPDAGPPDTSPTQDQTPPDAAAPPQAGAIVVSQIYGAGGNSGAKYTHDYVELFNRSTASVSIGGWSIQYGTAANAFSQKTDLPVGASIDPGQYYLVRLAGGSNGVPLPAPDLTSAYNISATAGKIALVANGTLLACGTATNRCTSTAIMDLVGYGGAADFEGGAAAVAPTLATQALFRRSGGCTDSDQNASDLEVLAAQPRNSAAAAHDCTTKLDGGVDAAKPDAAKPDTATPDAPKPDVNTVSDAKPPTEGAVADQSASEGSLVDQAPPPPSYVIVISQLYGAGGNSGASLANDYVELFNRSTQTIAIGGWSIQYGSAAGDFSQQLELPAGASIASGGYYLVQLAGGANGAALPTPDLVPVGTAAFNLGASGGKVALVRNGVLLACGSAANRCTAPVIEDLVGYGGASDHEGVPASAPSSATSAIFRRLGGCLDTQNNASDFFSNAAAPRNSAAPKNLCGTTPDLGPAADHSLADQRRDLAASDLMVAPPGDGRLDGARRDAGQTGQQDDGCTCATSASPSASSLPWLLLSLLFLGRRRRGPGGSSDR